jgi:hypothetical protein
MKRESWAALTLGLVLAHGCAEPEELGNVFITTLGASGSPGDADASVGGTGGDTPGQGGTGAAPATGGTGGAGGSGAAPATGGTGPAATGGTGGAPATGGTGGAPGTGGTDTGAGGTAAEPTGSCVEQAATTVFYTDRSQNNQKGAQLAIRQDPAGTFPLSDLVVRYWFNPGPFTAFVADIDNAQSATNADVKADVEVTFGSELGSSYADFNVGRADAIGNGLNSLQFRIHTAAYDQLDSSTDFSLVTGADNEINENITAYVDGVQVFGCTPPAQ